jgi:mRNA interferase RelE/StbE
VSVGYAIGWTERAIDVAAGFLDDPTGLSTVMDRIDELAFDPSPAAAITSKTPGVRRLRIGRYRVLYKIDDPTASITVIHLGRLG